MSKKKFDGVVNAVHYKPTGQVDWVRAYVRRGPTFSDRTLLDRQTLISHLLSGKRYFIGERIAQMAGTFEIGKRLRVVQKNDRQILMIGEEEPEGSIEQDQLTGLPVI
jgi:hypothetical protein